MQPEEESCERVHGTRLKENGRVQEKRCKTGGTGIPAVPASGEKGYVSVSQATKMLCEDLHSLKLAWPDACTSQTTTLPFPHALCLSQLLQILQSAFGMVHCTAILDTPCGSLPIIRMTNECLVGILSSNPCRIICNRSSPKVRSPLTLPGSATLRTS